MPSTPLPSVVQQLMTTVAVMPVQFHARTYRENPTKNLFLAVLDDALRVVDAESSVGRRDPHVREEAWRWFTSPDESLFSFRSCCLVLGLNAPRMRAFAEAIHDGRQRYLLRCQSTGKRRRNVNGKWGRSTADVARGVEDCRDNPTRPETDGMAASGADGTSEWGPGAAEESVALEVGASADSQVHRGPILPGSTGTSVSSDHRDVGGSIEAGIHGSSADGRDRLGQELHRDADDSLQPVPWIVPVESDSGIRASDWEQYCLRAAKPDEGTSPESPV